MTKKRPFLTAEWRNLILLTFAVPPKALAPYLPKGATPDMRHGSAFVSLVAFDFLKTRVMGVQWPGYTNFPEVNLRAYVKVGERRGVVFVREFVPQRLTCLIARGLYNEPYSPANLKSRVRRKNGQITVEHTVGVNGTRNSIRVLADDKPRLSPPDDVETFFKEHQWGFGKTRAGKPLRYEVRHPVWSTYPIRKVALDFDFSRVYGPEWTFLNDTPIYSKVLAEGSEIAVYPLSLLGISQ